MFKGVGDGTVLPVRATPDPAVSARPSVRMARARTLFLEREEVVSTFCAVTPVTNGPGESTVRRVEACSICTGP